MANFHFRNVPNKSFPLINSFCGIMDLKLGVSIISLFALLNKVAGGYGIISIFFSGNYVQFSFYVYSIITIYIFITGLKAIGQEDGPKTLLYAHLFAIDHFINTLYITFFAITWYSFTPHDGRRVANSAAQREVMESGQALLGKVVDENVMRLAAEGIWKEERGFSAAVLIIGWFIKFYFILCLYSFALHLKRQTYHSLPLSRPANSSRSSYRYNPQPSAPMRYTSTETTLSEGLWEEDLSSKAGEEIELELKLSEGVGSGMSRTNSSNGTTNRNPS